MKNNNSRKRRSAKASHSKRKRRRKANGTRKLSFEALESRLLLATVTVSTADDLIDGNTSSIFSLLSNPGADDAIFLREAVVAADNTFGSDTITFDSTVFNGDAADVIRLQSSLSISESVEIDGTGLDIVVSGDSSGNDALVPGSFVTDLNLTGSASLSDNTNSVFVIADRSGVVTILSLIHI